MRNKKCGAFLLLQDISGKPDPWSWGAGWRPAVLAQKRHGKRTGRQVVFRSEVQIIVPKGARDKQFLFGVVIKLFLLVMVLVFKHVEM